MVGYAQDTGLCRPKRLSVLNGRRWRKGVYRRRNQDGGCVVKADSLDCMDSRNGPDGAPRGARPRRMTKRSLKKRPPRGGLNPYQMRHGGDSVSIDAKISTATIRYGCPTSRTVWCAPFCAKQYDLNPATAIRTERTRHVRTCHLASASIKRVRAGHTRDFPSQF